MPSNASCVEGYIWNPITGKCEPPAYQTGNGGNGDNGDEGWGGLTGNPNTSIWGPESNFWDGITGAFESLTGQSAPQQGETGQGVYQGGQYVPPPSGGSDQLFKYGLLALGAFLVIKEVS